MKLYAFHMCIYNYTLKYHREYSKTITTEVLSLLKLTHAIGFVLYLSSLILFCFPYLLRGLQFFNIFTVIFQFSPKIIHISFHNKASEFTVFMNSLVELCIAYPFFCSIFYFFAQDNCRYFLHLK